MNENEQQSLDAVLDELKTAGIQIDRLPAEPEQWLVNSDDWCRLAEILHSFDMRWAAGWAEQGTTEYQVHACFARRRCYLQLVTRLALQKPQIPSQAGVYPAASRSERHTRDMYGIEFSGDTDARPWIRHEAWSKHEYPLRKDFPLSGDAAEVTPPNTNYQFVKARGSGVYEIPVGPVHAGIIEPGHFRFQAVGETVLNLEERLGYVHKGIEKLAEGRTPEQLSKLAGRISGDTTVAHSWAACRAMEQAGDIVIPLRAAFLRGLLCERERIANHLGDVGAICNDVGFAFAQMQMTRLREQWLRSQQQWFGHRLLMDTLTPGGVKHDISAETIASMHTELRDLRAELDEIIPALDLNSSLEDRLYTAGYLSVKTATDFGALGYVGRASGQDVDARRDVCYAPYDLLSLKVEVEDQGDVASRVWIRIKEVFASMKLIRQILNELPDDGIQADWSVPQADSYGLGIVEGFRGEIISFVRFGRQNTIERFYPRDPSLFNWLALEKIVINNIVPDFPVCNKSVNGSYSGYDL